jgi:hypothetical protein
MTNEAVRTGINHVMVLGNGHVGRKKTAEIKNGIKTQDETHHINAKTADTNHRQCREKAGGKPIGRDNTQVNARDLYEYYENSRASVFVRVAPSGTPGKQALTDEPNEKENCYGLRSHADAGNEVAVLGFGFVFAQSQAATGMLHRLASPKHQNSSLLTALVFLQTLYWLIEGAVLVTFN